MSFTARLTVMFGVFLGLFGMLGMRLWFVQVAEGDEAAALTESQSWVYIATPAPRGDIRDRDGDLLATSRFVPAVVVDRHLVDPDDRAMLIQRLSSMLAIPADEIDRLYEEAGVNGLFPVATVDTVAAYQISEQLRDLPGVRIEKVPERVYLAGESLAHVIGHLGLPTEQDLGARPELDPNTRIGKLGIEATYDETLQGESGEIAYQVREGQVVAQRPDVQPSPGNTLYLTIDLDLQEVVEQALVDGIELSNEWKAERRAEGEGGARNETSRAAAVVLDVQTGALRAVASVPSFDPSLFVGGLDADTYQELVDLEVFNNLATAGLYPPASTFKAVTYMTILEESVPLPAEVEGVDAVSRVVHCDGRLELPGLGDGSPQVFLDWYTGDKGWLDIHGALEQSCNIFFYSAALGIHYTWDGTSRETVLQDMARSVGFGSPTGIDLASDAGGQVPDRDLFLDLVEEQQENPDIRLVDPSRLESPDPWRGGDLMNLAIGQGEILATPLQVAGAYGALVNGGTLWRPYVVEQVRDASGELVDGNAPEVVRRLDLDPANVDSLLTDLNRVVTRGTAASAFADFGASRNLVGGKTGTGQSIASKDNHAWFVGVAPIDDPQYVVAVLIDEGGSGGAVAAPVARQIMQYLMGEDLTPIVAGEAAQ